MKNIVKTLVGVLLLAGCQNELYIDPQEEFGSEQGAYVASKGPVQIFVEEGKDYLIKDVKVGLALKESKTNSVAIQAGDQAQLDAIIKRIPLLISCFRKKCLNFLQLWIFQQKWPYRFCRLS